MQNLPFGQPGRFFKGNMHTHCTNSDGIHPLETVCRGYREAGYDFLVMTDHFMEVYDFPITDSRPHRTKDFTTIIGAELHAPQTQVGELWHIKAIGLPFDFEPLREGETGPEIAKRAHEAGAFIGIVHPSWYGLTHDDARELPFAHAVEIYNHGSHVETDRGHDWPFLDVLLIEGRRLTGYATDDAHQMTHDWLGGWVMVQAPENDPDALLESLKAGRYSSSQGPEIHDVAIEGDKVVVACSPASIVMLTGRGAASAHVMGEGLTRAELPLDPFKASHFRVTVVDADGKRAWSNPVWMQ